MRVGADVRLPDVIAPDDEYVGLFIRSMRRRRASIQCYRINRSEQTLISTETIMTNENTLSPSDTGMQKKRTGRLIAFGLICVLAALGYGLYWLLIARFTVYTDNAYVQGNVVQITPLISATVATTHCPSNRSDSRKNSRKTCGQAS